MHACSSCAHTYMHTCTTSHARTRIHGHTLAHKHARTHASAHAHKRTRTHMRGQMHAWMHACTPHTHACTHPCTHTRTFTHVRIYTIAHTYTCSSVMSSCTLDLQLSWLRSCLPTPWVLWSHSAADKMPPFLLSCLSEAERTATEMGQRAGSRKASLCLYVFTRLDGCVMSCLWVRCLVLAQHCVVPTCHLDGEHSPGVCCKWWTLAPRTL